MTSDHPSRRDMLGAAAGAAAFTLLPSRVLGRGRQTPPSGKLNIAGIGIGGMGGGNLANLASQNIVALCDVDLDYAAGTIARHPGARVWTDYRKMLEEQRDIDAVVIATPDHTHANIAMAAMRAGKHVYCQKPLTHTVQEARAMAEMAAKMKVATQMGIQGHSMGGARRMCEWVWAGAIGEIREVEAWCSLTYYPWGHAGWSSSWSERPKETPPVPGKLDWDLWLGPAPFRPYHRAYHPMTWRCWWDFGCGMMGDRGAHTLDPVVWALKLGAPTSIEATSCGGTQDVHPLSAIVTFRFPARPGFRPLKLTWYEGTRPPRPLELDADMELPGEGGCIIHGSKGKIVGGVYGNDPYLLPERLRKSAKKPPERIPRVPDEAHEMDWVRACTDGKPAGAHFGYSGPLTEMCLLGNVAKRVDGVIEWDAANLRVTNRTDCAALISPERRKGWEL